MGSGPPVLRIGLLGPLQVSVDGAPVAVTGRAAELLAALALNAGEPVTAIRLADRLWGPAQPDDPRRAIQVTVHRLRHRLGAAAGGRPGAAGYVLTAERSQVDVLRFTDLIEGARVDQGERREQLIAALALWRGQPFDSTGSDWLAGTEATRLAELRLLALQERIDLDLGLATSPAEELAAELEQLTTEYPLREPLWERLLLVLGGSGRQAEALERYEKARRHFRDELGTDPGPRLQELYRRLLTGEVEPPRKQPQQLPAPAAHFTGRTAELAALDEVLADQSPERVAIAAITGSGGAGKSTLTLHWAHRVKDRFPDGRLFLNLRGFSPEAPMEPADALDHLLRALGIPPSQIPPDVESRAALFRERTAGLQLLLVLDNASGSSQVRELLPGPGVVVVVTSRHQLRGLAARDGARRVMLGGFDASEALELFAKALGSQRVTAEVEAAHALAAACGGLPLALAVTAERATRFPDAPLSQLAEGLRQEQDRLDYLATPDDEGADLRAVFAWSYRALEPDDRRVFRLLGLPSGPFGVASAAALVDASPARTARALDVLVSASLVEQTDLTTYQLHDLVRAYAAERCAEEERPEDVDNAVRRVLHWLLATLGQAAEVVRPAQVHLGSPPPAVRPIAFDDFAATVRWFVQERAAILAWLGQAQVRRMYDELWRIAVPLILLLEITEYRADALATAEKVFASVDELSDPQARYVVYYLMGQGLQRTADFEKAFEHLGQALAGARALGHTGAEAMILSVTGIAHRRLGELDKDLELQRMALGLADAETAPGQVLSPSIAATYINLAGNHYQRYEFDKAIHWTQQALENARQTGDLWREVSAVNNLTVLHEVNGDDADARLMAEEAVAMADRLNAPALATEAITSQGRMLLKAGDAEGAVRLWRQALELLPGANNYRRRELLEMLAEAENNPATLPPATQTPKPVASSTVRFPKPDA